MEEKRNKFDYKKEDEVKFKSRQATLADMCLLLDNKDNLGSFSSSLHSDSNETARLLENVSKRNNQKQKLSSEFGLIFDLVLAANDIKLCY